MPVQNINCLINNNFQLNKAKVKKNTFETFVPQNSLYPQIPLNVSKAYITPQLYPEYKVLETFKLPNTGEGKVYQLRNGHKVIILPKKGATAINTQVGVGWQNEKSDKRNTAHLLEHLLATIQYKKDFKELQDISDEIILDANANTSSFSTNYYVKALITDNKELDKLLKFHYGIVCSADFSDKNYEHEKVTISNEMHYRNDNIKGEFVAAEVGLNTLLNLPENNELSNNVTQKHIDNIKKDDLVDFYNKYYRPDNMVTTIVGNVDENTIKTFSKYFNQAKNPLLKTKDYHLNKLVEIPIQKSVRNDVVNPDKKSNSHFVVLDFLVNDKMNNFEKECLYLASSLVQNSIKNEIDSTKVSVTPIINSDQEKNVLSINSEIKHSYSEEILKNIYKIITDLSNQPISEEELKKLKENYKEAAALDYAEDISAFYSNNLFNNSFLTLEKIKQIHSKITVKDIQETIKKYFNLNKVALTVVHPQENKKKLSFKGTLKLTDLYNISEYTLPNNIKVNINESDSVNETSINFKVQAKEMINTHTCARKYLHNAIYDTGVNSYCTKNNIYFDVNSNPLKLEYNVSGDTAKTLDMLYCITNTLTEPVLSDENDLAYWKDINKDIDKINNKIKEKYVQNLYEDIPWIANKDDIQTLTLKDVEDYYRNLLSNSQVSVNITIPKSQSDKYKQEILNELTKLPTFKQYSYADIFQKFQGKSIENNKVFLESNNNNLLKITKTYKIMKTGNVKDIVGIELLNLMLGDSFDGMLFKNLRGDKNLTYSVGSEYSEKGCLPNYGVLLLSANSNKDNFKKVNVGFDECINKLQTELVSEKDLKIAKKKFKSVFLYESAYTQNSYGQMLDDSFYGKNFIPELEKAIDEITPQFIREIAKYYLSQPALYSISGSKEAIEANKDYLKTLGEIVE